eukprot:scaffold35042_cov70-Phaeocystis_antarctica.AAC.4
MNWRRRTELPSVRSSVTLGHFSHEVAAFPSRTRLLMSTRCESRVGTAPAWAAMSALIESSTRRKHAVVRAPAMASWRHARVVAVGEHAVEVAVASLFGNAPKEAAIVGLPAIYPHERKVLVDEEWCVVVLLRRARVLTVGLGAACPAYHNPVVLLMRDRPRRRRRSTTCTSAALRKKVREREPTCTLKVSSASPPATLRSSSASGLPPVGSASEPAQSNLLTCRVTSTPLNEAKPTSPKSSLTSSSGAERLKLTERPGVGGGGQVECLAKVVERHAARHVIHAVTHEQLVDPLGDVLSAERRTLDHDVGVLPRLYVYALLYCVLAAQKPLLPDVPVAALDQPARRRVKHEDGGGWPDAAQRVLVDDLERLVIGVGAAVHRPVEHLDYDLAGDADG